MIEKTIVIAEALKQYREYQAILWLYSFAALIREGKSPAQAKYGANQIFRI